MLAELDDRRFAAREAATRQLAGLRERIEPALRQALQDARSQELRRRLRTVLDGPPRLSAEARRTLRAVAVLERIGTPEACRLLNKLGAGAPACETRAAKAALERLKRRGAAQR